MHLGVFVDGTPERLCRGDELSQVLGSNVRVVCSGPLLAGVTRSCVDLRLGYTLSLMPRVDRMPQCVGRTDRLQLRSPLLITKLFARRQPNLPTVIIRGLLGVNGGAKSGHGGGVKVGQRSRRDDDMERAPIGALSMSSRPFSPGYVGGISPVFGSADTVAWFCSALLAERRPADCLRR